MGTREFVKFLLFVTGFIGLAAFVSMLFVYYATRDETMLYKRFNGFQGVVAGMLIAVKQTMPDADVVGRREVARASNTRPRRSWTAPARRHSLSTDPSPFQLLSQVIMQKYQYSRRTHACDVLQAVTRE